MDLPDGNYVYLGTEYSSQANTLNQDIVELTDDLTFVKGHAHVLVRHAQRVLQVLQPVHPVPLRRLPVHQHRQLPGGIAQAYNHNFSNTSDPAGGGRGSRCTSSGFYAGDKWRARNQLHAHLRRARRPAALPGQAARQPGVGGRLRLRDRHRAGADDVVAARRASTGISSGGSGKRAQIRGGVGHVHRPHAVRLAVEPVRQHGRRLHQPVA